MDQWPEMSSKWRARGAGPPVSDDSLKPCFIFKRQGFCKFGTRCKFSHDTTETHPNHASQPSNNAPRPPRDGKLLEWKRLLEQGYSPARLAASAVSRFFRLGLELMDGDVGAAQEAIKLLATDEGLGFIKLVSDRHIPTATDEATRLALWQTEIKPLFSLVTHTRVIDSAVLEQHVASVFNFIYGVGGARMQAFFDYIVRLVKSWPTVTPDTLSRMATVELSLAVLSKVVDCNSTAALGPGFSKLVSDFAEIIKQPSNPDEEFPQLQAAKYLEYIQQRQEVGDNIPEFQRTHIPVTRETFVLRRDLPGRLSADGPRHDNDHTDITKIKIMPTYQEIVSPRGEYLPTNDPSEWHVKGIRGRLDREFRLVREDTVGQLRDSVREMLEFARNPNESATHRSQNSMRTYTYDYPTAIAVEFHRIGGLEMVVRCDQLPTVQKMSDTQRKDWWMQSKRLQAGALVCMFDVTGSMLFCTVSDTTMRSKDDKEARRNKDEETDGGAARSPPLTLSDDPESLYVKLQLVDEGKHEIKQAMEWYRDIRPLRRHLVEFPGVLLASFQHTLTALQQMHHRPNIPFQSLLAPAEGSAPEEIKAPQYARQFGFAFDLNTITSNNTAYAINPQQPPDPSQLAERSTLDSTQSAALLNTLSRELSLIQGPPGTGKSYTGEKIVKVLLANKDKAKLGPILCVCYTNHALDQLLEHLLDDGTKSIIRIGSRSKSERLQNLNLRTVVKGFLRTKSEKSGLYSAEQLIKEHVGRGNELLRQLSVCDSWRSVKNFLATEYPRHHTELFGETAVGWETVRHQPEKIIDIWIQSGPRLQNPNRSPDILKALPLQTMTYNERLGLYRHWLKSIRAPIIARLVTVQGQYNEEIKHRDRIRGDVDLRCLQEAEIVGATTTGLAKSLETLRKLRCKVMLCEEAGEVLEAHILTALLPSVEHGILIGDHLQLRPQIQNYDLQSTNPRGQQYSLDMSLFERLVQPPHDTDLRVPYSILETQRRMHPSIAELVRSTLYPALKDAETVTNYPGVVGMKKRLFWFHHERLEGKAQSNDALSTSHTNDFEVEMTAALVSHLSQQGAYAQGDIAVLTPYLGQLHRLRRRMESMFDICVNERDLEELDALQADGAEVPVARTSLLSKTSRVSKTTLLKSVRVATVDNFQGEEAKVIVISLVRSNPQSNCGFLRTSNRINVLLSRAQHGMYIIGNSDTYREVPMWANVIKMLAKNDNFGSSLELQCPRHPNTPILVSEPDHFMQFSPESGCNKPCDKRLLCGHSCPGRCHADNLHLAVRCLEDCPRLKKGCDHACPLRCGEPCQSKCQALVENINLLLPCGHHLASAKCFQAQDPQSVRCMTMVSRTVPGCNHSVTVPCHEDVTDANYRCNALCGDARPCGHTCKGTCCVCNTRAEGKVVRQNHGICKQPCGRNYSTCRHSCIQLCHDGTQCKPCGQQCEVRCSHSRCSKTCHEPCAPCAESTCESSCPHAKCTVPCAAPCNWVPCSLRCEKMLDCGHQCPSICGETCPDPMYCQQCASSEIKASCVDFLEMKEYHEVDLNEEPCIFPDCGHFLTVSSMDGQMDMSAHYKLDDNGLPRDILGGSKPFSMDDQGVKGCATCRGPLRNISRYGRIVRRAMLDIATKKFIAWSNSEYLVLAERLVAEQEKLAKTPAPSMLAESAKKDGNLALPGSRSKQINALKNVVGKERYRPISKYRSQLIAYSQKVGKEEQPFQRVAELVRYANLQHGTDKAFQYDQSIIQVKGLLLAFTLLMKCDVAILFDFLGVLRPNKSSSVESAVQLDLSAFLQDCEYLIQLAHSTKFPREEVQGHIFYAQLCALCRSFGPSQEPSAQPAPNPSPPLTGVQAKTSDELAKIGRDHVNQARQLLEEYPSTAVFKNEVDAIENTLLGSFYRPVTAEELREVYMASAAELRGTGHWYTCANGHPFSINNCGMPMEEARCPDCNAPIGGRNHEAAEGVRHATEIEEIARGVDRLGLE